MIAVFYFRFPWLNSEGIKKNMS